MQRMTGIDPMFIYSDTPETPMEIAYACVFDPVDPPRGLQLRTGHGVLRDADPDACSRSGAGSCPSRSVWTTRAGWTTPSSTWPTTCTGSRCRRPAATPSSAAKVADVMGRPLLPEQPPWEMHVVEGMADGMVGLIAKVHHAVIDGVAGAEMLAKLLDLTAEGSAVTEPCPPWVPPRLPSQTQLMTDALPSFIRSPVRGVRAAREVGRTAVRLARCAVDDRLGPMSIPLGAPDTFESPVGADRAVSFAELDMARGPGAQDPFRLDDQRRRARRLLGRAAHASGRARPGRREPAGRRGAGVGARRQGRGRAGQPPLRHVRAAVERPEDAARAPADRDARPALRARVRSVPSATGRWRPC